ncbi:MobC family plasmid mobilization relaxosome protein (plasmid) [Moraxella atlantae]|uniref:MobC family plasmid mobilization relaxosome protein n=1 Tax=Faucicola atlantae TaxID=34059 RepID=UPI003750AB94
MPKILGEKRTREIKIRLTDTEFEALQSRRTKNLAGWLRDLALGSVPIHQADPTLVRQVAKIGNNLNQIARHANTERQLDRQVLIAVNESNKLLRQLVELHKN